VIRQLDIVQNPDTSAKGQIPYLLVLQSDTIDTLSSVVVAPVFRDAAAEAMTRTTLMLEVNGESLLCKVHELVAVNRRRLGPAVGNAGDRYDDLIRAIDMIFSGI
jgi:hypothetical protein